MKAFYQEGAAYCTYLLVPGVTPEFCAPEGKIKGMVISIDQKDFKNSRHYEDEYTPAAMSRWMQAPPKGTNVVEIPIELFFEQLTLMEIPNENRETI